MRRGALRALDVEGFKPHEQALELVYREETGTPSKNNDASERLIASSSDECEVTRESGSHARGIGTCALVINHDVDVHTREARPWQRFKPWDTRVDNGHACNASQREGRQRRVRTRLHR